MKTLIRSTLLLLAAATSFAATPDAAALKRLAAEKLVPLAHDTAIVEAVKTQNRKGRTLAEIQAADKAWMSTAGTNDTMKGLMTSPAATHLRDARQDLPFLSEAFVMDKLGANVAMTDKTSDYWQGDEAKFTDCVKSPDSIWVGKVEFDESTQTYSVQISVPIAEGNEVIGAVCFGIDVEKI